MQMFPPKYAYFNRPQPARVYTWGYNDYGQLGWGLHGKDRTGQQKPKEVALPCDQEEKPPKARGAWHSCQKR